MYDPWCTFYIDLPLACKHSVWLAGEVFFKPNKWNKVLNQTKPSYEFTWRNSKGCVHKKNNNYVALCIYKPYRGESESKGKISVYYKQAKLYPIVILWLEPSSLQLVSFCLEIRGEERKRDC